MNRSIMKRLGTLAIATASLSALSTTSHAQLPSPSYGWNLGNTMEATCGVGCWSPQPTQALINAVANAGFNTIRIPCAWDTHANQTTHQIDGAYLKNVNSGKILEVYGAGTANGAKIDQWTAGEGAHQQWKFQ